VRRPGRLSLARERLPLGQFEQRFQRPWVRIDLQVPVADLPEPLHHRLHRKVFGLGVGDFSP
jgi:hypothetical protein